MGGVLAGKLGELLRLTIELGTVPNRARLWASPPSRGAVPGELDRAARCSPASPRPRYDTVRATKSSYLGRLSNCDACSRQVTTRGKHTIAGHCPTGQEFTSPPTCANHIAPFQPPLPGMPSVTPSPSREPSLRSRRNRSAAVCTSRAGMAVCKHFLEDNHQPPGFTAAFVATSLATLAAVGRATVSAHLSSLCCIAVTRRRWL